VDIEILRRDPQILLVYDFVSIDEARYLMAAGDRKMERSTVVCDDPNGCVDGRRTSESAHLGYDPNVEHIRQRAMEFARLPRCETLQVVRYHPGQEFQPHFDQFDPSTGQGAREIRSGGQRAATLLIYLNEPEAGGATVFPNAGLSVLPKARAAVFWRHQLPNGQSDPGTLHGGAPVVRGVKYAVNAWLRRPPQRQAHVQINPQLTPLHAW
jgi:prolyl 4-hydroxylase